MITQRHFSRFLILAVISVLILSCASSVPRPGPVDSQSSGLCIALAMNESAPFTTGLIPTEMVPPDIVLFVRLEVGEDLDDLLSKRVLIRSTFVSDEYAYLLNVPSGTYVAVAAIWSKDVEPLYVPVAKVGVGSSHEATFRLDLTGGELIHRNYFSEEMIAETVTTVAPAAFAFMGSFTTDPSLRFGDADETQVHFLKVLEGDDVDQDRLLARHARQWTGTASHTQDD